MIAHRWRPRPPVDMRCSCFQAVCTPKALQIRNLPDDLHRKLKVRAASLGVTLSDYARRELP